MMAAGDYADGYVRVHCHWCEWRSTILIEDKARWDQEHAHTDEQEGGE